MPIYIVYDGEVSPEDFEDVIHDLHIAKHNLRLLQHSRNRKEVAREFREDALDQKIEDFKQAFLKLTQQKNEGTKEGEEDDFTGKD